MRTADRVLMASVFALFVSSVMAASSLRAVSQRNQHTKTEWHNFRTQRDSLADRVDEIQYLADNYRQFEQLIDTPGSSAQRRVARAELIKKAASDLDLPSMTFVMHPFQPFFATTSDILVAGYEEAEIEMQLTHDTQLVGFLEYLSSNNAEEYISSTLRVKRLENSVSANNGDSKLVNLQVNLLVNFTIRWFSYEQGDVDAASG